MKVNKLLNKLIAAAAFAGILVAGYPQAAWSAANLISVCRENGSSSSRSVAHINRDGKVVTIKKNQARNGNINKSGIENDLKWSQGKYKFTSTEARAVKGQLPSTSVANLPLCSEAASPTISLKGTVRDFQASHPDFEFGFFNRGGTGLDENIVTTELGADKKPVFNSSYSGTTASTAENFNQWYNDVAGVNQRKTLDLQLIKDPATGMYVYESEAFFPINGELYGNIENDPSITAPTPNQAGRYDLWENQGYKERNYHFTYEAHQRFTYKGGEEFTFSGDDDVWVYLNGKRIIDIGGVHGEESQTVKIDDIASEAGVNIGGTYDFDFFFAERNFSGSNFKITTNMELEENLDVSLELVLSVDVSTSVDASEYRTQVNGYIAALQDPEVQEAIKALPKGMAINMQFWGEKDNNPRDAGVADTGWYKLIKNGDSIDGLADFAIALDSISRTIVRQSDYDNKSEMPINGVTHKIKGGTDVKLAIEEAANLLLTNEYKGDRLVIDISGDGIPKDTPYPEATASWDYGYVSGKCGHTLDCPPVVAARDAVIAKGITINGLPINAELPGSKTIMQAGRTVATVSMYENQIDDYYRTQVVGGNNSFTILADGFDDFERAVKLKILNEIKPIPNCEISDGCYRPNTKPEAQDDEYKVVPGTTTSLDVTINDLDADGDSLTISDFYIDDTSGTLSIVNNQLVYVAPDSSGTYTFKYEVYDGNGGVDRAAVEVQVLPFAD
ncbi:MAG: DUF1194 domain-containing protein [Cyanobacteria bacterium J06631_6]